MLPLRFWYQSVRWIAVAFTFMHCVEAQDSNVQMGDVIRRLEALENRLQKSEEDLGVRTKQLNDALARIGQLETQLGSTAPAAPQVNAEPVQIATVSQVSEHDHDSPVSGTSMPHLNIRGFGDFNYLARRSSASTANTFALGQFDLFITSKVSDRLGAVVELVFEPDLNNSWGLDLERAFLQYRFNRYFKLDAGRNHTAIGYYNTAFHHATWLQTATGRPFLFSFEDQGGPLPVHGVGVSASGDIPSGRLGLGYVASVVNGRAFRQPGAEPVQNRVDDNRGKAVNLALIAKPDAIPGLQVGASVYLDRLTPAGAAAIKESISSGYLVYQHDRVEFLSEAVWMRHRQLQPQGGQLRTSIPGGYTQFGYRLGSIRPYIRFEYLNPAATDPVARQLLLNSGRNEFLGGVRYDFAEFAALKFQLGRLSQNNIATQTLAALQLSFTF